MSEGRQIVSSGEGREMLSCSSLPSVDSTELGILYFSFLGCSGKHFENAQFIIEFATNEMHEFSWSIPTNSKGIFAEPVFTALDVDEDNEFIFHKLDKGQTAEMKINHIESSGYSKRTSTFCFSLDSLSICEQLASTRNSKVLQTLSFPSGDTMTFEASFNTFLSDEQLDTLNQEDEQLHTLEEETRELPSPHCSCCRASTASRPVTSVACQGSGGEQIWEPVLNDVTETNIASRETNIRLRLNQTSREIRDIKVTLGYVTELIAGRSSTMNRNIPGEKSKNRKRLVLDGDVIAHTYGGEVFRTKGIEIALEYYARKDRSVVAIVSGGSTCGNEKRRESSQTNYLDRLKYLMQRGLIHVSPLEEKHRRHILKCALDQNADVVSNDTFGTLGTALMTKKECAQMGWLLETRLITFSFVGDTFIPNEAPSTKSAECSGGVAM